MTGSIRINDSCVISMTINLSGSPAARQPGVLADLDGETWSPKRLCAPKNTDAPAFAVALTLEKQAPLHARPVDVGTYLDDAVDVSNVLSSDR